VNNCCAAQITNACHLEARSLMRTLQVMSGAALLLFVSAEGSSVGANAQTPPSQGAPVTAQPAGRGPDPQGPPLVPTPARTTTPTPDKDGNFVIGPPYVPAPELTVKDDVPKGTIHEFTMDSKDSKIYPGIARAQPGAVVPYTRQVAVYVPARYVAGTPAPFIVVQDGMSPTYRNNLPTILDNLIHEKRVPALIAVMVHTAVAMPRAVSVDWNTTRSQASTRISSRPKSFRELKRTTTSP
jgi:hypothetical protein